MFEVISNPNSHLWKILCEAHVNGSVQTEIIFVFESFDGFDVLFVQIDRCFSFWFFLLHSYYSLNDKIYYYGLIDDFTDSRFKWHLGNHIHLEGVFYPLRVTIIYIHTILTWIETSYFVFPVVLQGFSTSTSLFFPPSIFF